MSLIRVASLTVRFGDDPRPVLDGLRFELAAGERALLLGPSGAGKSTLLLALTGLLPRSVEAAVTGQVLLDGRPVAGMSPAEVCRRVGLVLQEPDSQFCMLYPDDEVAFGLENLAMDPAAMPARIAGALNRVGLGPAQRQMRIDGLSGGQQQRLALASVLAQEPGLLLLDEPTSLLDPAGRRAVVAAAGQAAAAGHGLLVVEHLLDPWLPLLNRLLILDPNGRLLDDGPPGDLFQRWGRYLDEIGVWRPRQTDRGSTALPEAAAGPVAGDPVVAAGPVAPGPRPSAPPVAEWRDVTAGYRGRPPVIRNVTLAIGRGEFWALVGPNGSGKSTLAQTLIGMIQPAAGQALLEGDDVTRLGARALADRAGYVFQNPEHQFVADSVWAELTYSLRRRRMDPGRRRERVAAALQQFGLADLAGANPFNLSGGEKRRLAVAAMLVGGQPLLVLDEPTFGQDRRGARQLMDRIAGLHRAGTAVLLITHDMDLVDAYATYAAVLAGGQLHYRGPVPDLWARPDLLAGCGLELPRRLHPCSGAVGRRPSHAVPDQPHGTVGC